MRYFEEAFWYRWKVPGFGELPVNALACAGFFILGFGHPAFWLLGLGLETVFLTGLATNKRFQNLVDGKELEKARQLREGARHQLVGKLTGEDQEALERLEGKCRRLMETTHANDPDNVASGTNQGVLDEMLTTYLKLLVARRQILSGAIQATEEQISSQIRELEDELQNNGLSSALRESKEATLAIMRKRQTNLAKRETTRQELESNMRRIESEIELAMENASLSRSSGVDISVTRYAGEVLQTDMYGDLGSDVAKLESM